MAGPIRISVLAEASKARKELAGTEKNLGSLGNAGDKASGKLKALATSVEPAFARLRAEANKALESIPRDAAGSIDKTAKEFQQLSPEMKRAVQSAARVAAGELRAGAFAQAGEDAGDEAAQGFSSSLSSGIKGAGPALAGALAAVGAGGLFAEALQQTGDRARLGASLGLSDREAKQYGRAAGRLYAGAYAESVGEAGTALAAVRTSFRNLDGGEIEAASRRALSFADIFETDVSRATQIAGQAVRNGLAKNATEAFDLLTAASQKVPPSLREDVLDAAEEYGGFFRQLGYSGDQAFSTLVRGADKGMFGIDKAGDAIKEFSLLSTDLSTSSRDAYGQIGLDAEKMADRILAGGGSARRATNDIIDGLLAVENPAERANAAVALFGTPIEDLNKGEIPQFLRSLRSGKSELGKFGGAADRAAEQYGNSAQQKLTKFGNGIKQDVTERIVDALPEIQATARELNTTFGPTLKQAGEIAQTAGEFFADLPGPLKQFLGVAGGSALVLPRLSSAIGSSAANFATFGTNLSTARANTSQFVGQVRNAETRAGALRGALQRVGPAARGAAGIGGLAALTAGASTSNDALGTLADVGGGALLGFAAGGPIGAAVGGTVSGLLSLKQNADAAKAAAEASRGTWEEYALTLDQVTGATLQQTRATVYDKLVKSGAIRTLSEYGLSARQVIDAAVGQEGATRKVTAAMQEEQSAIGGLVQERNDLERAQADELASSGTVDQARQDRILALEDEIKSRQGVVDGIRNEIGEVRKSVDKKREEILATREYGAAIKRVPPEVRTFIRTNVDPTARDVARLAKQYKLTPKQIRTVLRLSGSDSTLRQVQRIKRNLGDVGRTRPNLDRYQRGLRVGVRAAENNVGRGTRRINRQLNQTGRGARPQTGGWQRQLGSGVRGGERTVVTVGRRVQRALENSTSRARPELAQFTGGLRRDVDNAGRTADRGARGIADDLRRGTGRSRADLSGFNSSIASGAGAARGTAQSGGSSVGATLKSSVISGFQGTGSALAAQAAAAVTSAINAANAAARNRGGGGRREGAREALGRTGTGAGLESLQREAKGSSVLLKSLRAAAGRDVRAVQDRLAALGKEWGRNEDRINDVTKGLVKQSQRLVQNARNQDKLTRRVSDATRRLAELKQAQKEYAGTIRSTLLESGSLTGIEEGHLNDPRAFLSARQAALAEAKRFDAAIRALRGQLNAADLRALVEAGPEQGLAAAEALVAGLGTGVVAEMNQVQSELAKLGGGLGDRIAKDYLQAGINAQAKLLRGLQGDQRRASKTGRTLASALLRAFRDRLGGPTGRSRQGAAESLLGNRQAGTNRARAMGRDLARAQSVGFNEEQRRAQQRRQQQLARTSARASAPKAAGSIQAQQVMVSEVRFTAKDVSDVLAGQAIVKRVRAYEKTKARK